MFGMSSVDPVISLRHTLATLAYRLARAVEDAPAEFANFPAGSGAKPVVAILAHIGDLMDWAVSLVENNQKWNNAKPLPWNAEVSRVFAALQLFDRKLSETEVSQEIANRLFQGPIADALTHTGQIAMLRRMSGSPQRGENYYIADIAAGTVGLDQPPPRKTF